MNIILGHELDSGAYPDSLADKDASQGVVVVGPAGLISILETRLGLAKSIPNPGIRIGAYLKFLKQHDDGQRFYSKSLKADAWSTAKTILAWRDQLKMAGWDNNASCKTSPRLSTISELEKLFQNELLEGHVDRLHSICNSLIKMDKIDISAINLIEPQHTWDFLWLKVFELLGQCGVSVLEMSKTPSSKSHNLGFLQQAFETGKPITEKFTPDHSLCVITAQTEWEASEAIASFLEVEQESNHKVLIIRGGGSRLLDDTLNRHGLPRLGHDSMSRWRTTLQVLPLVLANYWEPFSAQRLLEFLSLPKAPVRRKIRSLFADALREHPGILGPKWNHALQEAFKLSDAKDLDAFKTDLNFWFGTEKRYRPDDGLPVGLISEICSKLSKWAGQEGGTNDDVLMLKASFIFDDFKQTVEMTAQPLITEAQLNRILDSTVGEGLEGLDSFSQATPWSLVDIPGQIWGEADTIIWWNFTSNGVSPLHIPWSKDELGDLKNLGVSVLSTKQARLLESSSWRNVIKWAGQTLILVKPSSIAGESVDPHPFWDEINYLLNPNTGNPDLLIFDASRLWKQSSVSFLGRDLSRKAVDTITTPQALEQWQIQPGQIQGKSKESPTGMGKLISCPLSWVLEYILRISPQLMISLPSGSQMVGTLAHAVFEQVFTKQPLPFPEDAYDLARDAFDILAPQMASSILLPQQKPEKERTKERIAFAAKNLCDFIIRWNLTVKGMEEERHREDFNQNQEFYGRMDLILENSSHEEIIIDLKWSKKSDYKRDELSDGKAIQLAAYAWLLAPGKAKFPSGAYYMLAQSEFLGPNGDFIDPQYIVSEANLNQIWQASFETYQQHIQDIKSGKITASGVSQSLMSSNNLDHSDDEPADGNLPKMGLEAKCNLCDFANLCGMGGVEA